MAECREDTFLKEHAGVVAVAGGQAVQVELDRFSLATSLLALASRAHWALPCTLAAPNPPDVMGATPPDSIKAKFEKQASSQRSGFKAGHTWLILAWGSSYLEDLQLLKRTLSVPVFSSLSSPELATLLLTCSQV